MASAAPSSHRASDLGKEQRSPTERGMDFRFVWYAPSPTPDEVADLEERFPDVIQLPPEILSDECCRWSSSALIARSTWRWVQPESIVREFKRGGVPGEIEAIPLAHRCIIFRCTDPSAPALILRRPWVVNGQPIATEAWSSEFIPAADSVSSALLWLRLPRLPMEFWTDQLLRSIVLPAGEFQFSDEATLARRRGGYARVCVRVDLRNPLRPGARIRGSLDPFWQQFSYEHVDGFCSNCGSLHYSNPCSPDPKAGASTVGAKFGPWLAAVRHRTPVDGGSEQRRKKQGQPSPGSRPAHPSPVRRASSEAGAGSSEQ